MNDPTEHDSRSIESGDVSPIDSMHAYIRDAIRILPCSTRKGLFVRHLTAHLLKYIAINEGEFFITGYIESSASEGRVLPFVFVM